MNTGTLIPPLGMAGAQRPVVYSLGIPCQDKYNVMILPERKTERKDFPMGMSGITCGGKKEPIQSLKNTKGLKINGVLDEFGRPVCEMLISTGKIFTYVAAVIDTGAYHTHINNEIARKLGSVCKNEENHNNPVYGSISLPIYMMTYAFKEREDIYFVSDVRGMDFDADMIIGGQFILEFCDLYIYGKEKRFELIFY